MQDLLAHVSAQGVSDPARSKGMGSATVFIVFYN